MTIDNRIKRVDSGCPSRLSIARWTKGELPESEQAGITGHIEGCEACRVAVRDLSSHVEEYQEENQRHWQRLQKQLDVLSDTFPTDKSSWPLSTRSAKARLWSGSALARNVALLAAAIAIVLGVVVGLKPKVTNTPRYKGIANFQVVAKRGTEQFFVTQNQELNPKDALRFIVTTDRKGYLSIFSVDGRGVSSPFYPGSEPAAEPAPLYLEGAGRHELEESIILDDAPGPERIFFLFAEQPFNRKEFHRKIVVWLAKHFAEPPTAAKIDFAGQLRVLTLRKTHRNNP